MTVEKLQVWGLLPTSFNVRLTDRGEIIDLRQFCNDLIASAARLGFHLKLVIGGRGGVQLRCCHPVPPDGPTRFRDIGLTPIVATSLLGSKEAGGDSAGEGESKVEIQTDSCSSSVACPFVILVHRQRGIESKWRSHIPYATHNHPLTPSASEVKTAGDREEPSTKRIKLSPLEDASVSAQRGMAGSDPQTSRLLDVSLAQSNRAEVAAHAEWSLATHKDRLSAHGCEMGQPSSALSSNGGVRLQFVVEQVVSPALPLSTQSAAQSKPQDSQPQATAESQVANGSATTPLAGTNGVATTMANSGASTGPRQLENVARAYEEGASYHPRPADASGEASSSPPPPPLPLVGRTIRTAPAAQPNGDVSAELTQLHSPTTPAEASDIASSSALATATKPVTTTPVENPTQSDGTPAEAATREAEVLNALVTLARAPEEDLFAGLETLLRTDPERAELVDYKARLVRDEWPRLRARVRGRSTGRGS